MATYNNWICLTMDLRQVANNWLYMAHNCSTETPHKWYPQPMMTMYLSWDPCGSAKLVMSSEPRVSSRCKSVNCFFASSTWLESSTDDVFSRFFSSFAVSYVNHTRCTEHQHIKHMHIKMYCRYCCVSCDSNFLITDLQVKYVRSEVFTVVTMKNVMPCGSCCYKSHTT
jgi:hypothetical protein